jgi:hypothetical protein
MIGSFSYFVDQQLAQEKTKTNIYIARTTVDKCIQISVFLSVPRTMRIIKNTAVLSDTGFAWKNKI